VRAAEHPLELKPLDFPPCRVHVATHLGNRGFIVLGFGHFEQVSGVAETAINALQHAHHAIELGPFAAEGFGAGGILPDLGIFQRLLYLGQPLALAVEVKDTPGGLRTDREDRESAA
jgi:hypothetical protein